MNKRGDALGLPGGSSVLSATLAAGMVLAAAGSAHATNGYFSNGYGTASKGLAGAGVASDTTAMGLALNPALGNMIGNQAEFCVSIFNPERDTTIGAGGPLVQGKHNSEDVIFPIPCVAGNFVIDDRTTFGVAVYGNGGLNSDYDTNMFRNFFPGANAPDAGVDLAQLFASANVSYRVGSGFDIGVAPILAVQRFAATGLGGIIDPTNPATVFGFGGFSSDPTKLSDNDYDWSYGGGVKLGFVWNPNEYFTIGGAYQSHIWMTEFDKYAGLFADQGDFDIPPTATIGVSVRPAPQEVPMTLIAEYQRIWYDDVDSVGATQLNLGPGSLGASGGPGFGWADMDIFRFAAIFEATEQLTLRTGISFNGNFLDNDREVLFNILAPATPKVHTSVGFSYDVDENWSLNGAYTHAWSEDVTGNAALVGAPGQSVKLRMHQNDITIGGSYKW